VIYVTSKLIAEAVSCVPGAAIYNVVSWFQTNVSRVVSNFNSDKARREVDALVNARKAVQKPKVSEQATKAAARASAVAGAGLSDKVLREQVKEDLQDAKRMSRIQYLKKLNEEETKPAASEESVLDSVDAEFSDAPSPASRRQQQQQDELTLWKREYRPRQRSPQEETKLSEKSTRLREQFLETQNKNKKYQTMQAQRRKLPSYEMRDQVMDAIAANQVILISGATGCGKTTQVGQFVLDGAFECAPGHVLSLIIIIYFRDAVEKPWSRMQHYLHSA
jgi:flagellar biosynthesis GTPase FlhF